MLEIPDTLHNIIALACAGFILGYAWSIGTFAVGMLTTTGKVIALCVLLLALVALVFGKV